MGRRQRTFPPTESSSRRRPVRPRIHCRRAGRSGRRRGARSSFRRSYRIRCSRGRSSCRRRRRSSSNAMPKRAASRSKPTASSSRSCAPASASSFRAIRFPSPSLAASRSTSLRCSKANCVGTRPSRIGEVRLLRLEIDDFALVAHAELEFANGFTVCSGETGSGKTMLLGALAFVLGERASAEIVRAGASRTRVTLEVESDAVLQARLLEDGFEGERGEAVLFTRELSASGKSTARVNGQLATAAQLRTFGETFVERIGQHEQQRLLSRAYQLDVLDAFGGEAATAKRAEIVRAYERSIVAERALRELTDDVGRAAAELEFARFAAAEIDDTALADGEDATLRERRDYLANVEKIKTALAGVRETLAGEGGVHEGLGSAAGALGALSRYGASLAALAATLSGLQSETHEAAVAIVRELEATEYDPGELEAVAARLDFIERIKKKYGGALCAGPGKREGFAEEK